MGGSWEVLFLPQFKRDLDRLPKGRVAGWLEELGFLQQNPYAPVLAAKRLKSKGNLFRLKVGQDWRIVYRVVDVARQVLLLRFKHRSDVYRGSLDSTASPQGSFEELNSITQRTRHEQVPIDKPVVPTLIASVAPTAELPLPVTPEPEQLEELVVDRDELYLIGIPEKWHDAICSSGSFEEMRKKAIPSDVILRLEDYATAPDQTHVGKIYALGSQGNIASIASQPLGEFLLALDLQQREIVDKPLNSGPMMVRGGPGTGKTLICISRLKRIYHERAAESLFSPSVPVFQFISYNRALTGTNHALFAKLLPKHDGAEIRFATFDSVVNKIADRCWGKDKAEIPDDGQFRWVLRKNVLEPLEQSAQDGAALKSLLDRYSYDFLLDEFESVIHGNGIRNKDAYLGFPRKGRKTALRAAQRELVWRIYERFIADLKRRGWSTWEQRRMQVLEAMERGDIHYPKADALIVDELQDLSVTAIRLILHLVKDPRFLMLSGDAGQSIYNKAPAWRGISDKLRFHAGNSFVLRRSYRMTREIAEAISPLRHDPDDDADKQWLKNAVFSGPRAHWINWPEQQHVMKTVELIARVVQSRGINAGQIGVIVRFTNQIGDLRAKLEGQGFSVNVVNQENPLDIDGESIHLLTVYAAKGLEFPFVFVPFVREGVYPLAVELEKCHDETERLEALEQEQKLLYVALSRAARELWMLADDRTPSAFLKMLNADQWTQEN